MTMKDYNNAATQYTKVWRLLHACTYIHTYAQVLSLDPKHTYAVRQLRTCNQMMQ